jgi:putative (di)nucleoside polyphosphate hydrolase
LTLTEQTTHPDLPLRPCVGIMLINRHGRAWIGQRRPRWIPEDAGPIWQMPQGGILPGEPPRDAALRELYEETGVRSVTILAEAPRWLTYRLPDYLLGIALKGRYSGQRQRWFAMRFLGDDSEISLIPPQGGKAEFETWRWADISELSSLALPFKRPVYEAVIREFAHLIR